MSFYIKFILSLIILVTPPTLVFAQTPSPSPQPAVFEDLLRQIQELFAQIQRIEQQIINLRGTPVTAPAAEPVQPATPTFQGLKRGDRGPTVNDLQKFLIDEGYLLIRLPTGFFGPLTEAAMRRFQDENGLPTTGRLDTETRTVVETRRGLTFVIPGLIQEGTGASGQIPPGLLIAPGIQGQLLSTGTPPFGTGTPPYGTGTPPFGTGTPGALPSPSPSVSQCSNYGGAGQCLSNPYCAWMNNSCVPASSIGPCLSWMTIPIVLEGGCHSMGNAYFNGPMTKYLSANASEGSWPTLCSQAWIPNCTVQGPGFTPSPLPSPIPSATSTPPTPTPSSGNGTSTPPTTPAPRPSPTPPSSSTAPITVTSPNGESIWDVYHYNQGIYWILNGVSRVGFKLLKGSQVVYSNSSPITSNNTTLSIPPTLDGIPTAYYNSIGGGSDYKIRVFDWDNPGVYDDSDNYFTIPLPDITPPVVSSVTASSITSNSAIITWTTDEPATGFVNYGSAPNNWVVTPTITSYSTLHSLTLSNLGSNTLYTYRVYSVDSVSNGPQGYPPEHTFTTLSGSTGSSSLQFNPSRSNNFAAITRNLTVGSSGNDVKKLQALLVNEVGYSSDLITGYFGRITRDAVKRLQEKYGIKPTYGYFGEITRRVLSAILSDR